VRAGVRPYRAVVHPPPDSKGTGSMDTIMNFFNSWAVMGGLIVALLVLIGVLLFLRNKNKDED
jgi:LPXTG-motif cell wall-anchored protein